MARFTNETRKQRINELMEMLRKGQEVAKRDFDLAVGKEFAKLYEERWAEQKSIRKMEVPEEVKEYEQILQDALMMYGRAEQFNVQKSGTGKTLLERQNLLDELSNKAEGMFEDALTRLEEIVTEDQGLRIWFDRDINFEAGNGFSFEPGGMPRVITSKSQDNLAKEEGMKRFGWQTKAQVKLSVMQQVLDGLDRDTLTAEEIEADAAQKAKLKGLLKKLGS